MLLPPGTDLLPEILIKTNLHLLKVWKTATVCFIHSFRIWRNCGWLPKRVKSIAYYAQCKQGGSSFYSCCVPRTVAPKEQSTHGEGQLCLQLHALLASFTRNRKLLSMQVKEAVWKMFWVSAIQWRNENCGCAPILITSVGKCFLS